MMINDITKDMAKIEACKVELEALKTMQDLWSKMYEIGTLDKEKFDSNMIKLIEDALNVRNDMNYLRIKND